MMPVYSRYMDSNPYQRNQTFSFPQYQYLVFRADSPMAFEPQPWPYGGNYGHPMPCHSCCNHNNGPGYAGFRPSYPHPSMPSPVQFFGGYPAAYHEAYPVHYVPPPHYSMEIPKYEYDKNMPRNFHCCGCPNHTCHQNVDKGVRIEEQGPVAVEKKADDSLVPVHMKNYPYPIVWIPPESMNGREQRKVTEPEIIEEEKIPTAPKPPENLKSQEDQRHSWFPFDLNDIGSLMQGGNREQVRDQQKEDKKKEFPFPIFWIPSYEEAGEKDKDANASQDQQSEDQKKQFPFPFFWLPYENKQEEEVRKEDNGEVNASRKFVPMRIAEAGNVTGKTGVNEEKPAGEAVEERKEKTANQKSIPVKQMDPHKEDNSKVAPVKHAEDNVANIPSGTSVKRQSSSPKKSSELPPVCLRVDPLPRKKKGNGNSRSPSPPGKKGLKQESSTDTTKASASAGLQENTEEDSKSQNCISSNSKEVEPSKKEKKIEVMDRTTSESKDALLTSQIPVNFKEEVSRKTTVGESEKDGDRCQINEVQGARKVVDDTTAGNVKPVEAAKSVGDRNKLQKKTLSDVEAAILIQSAYRGFEVRRWEPLKKLKQIAEVREQMADVKNHMTSLETSDLQIDDKQRVVIGETIMRLLLKLDTIQGLLPSLRDIRRSLARELVVLQEKLDALMAKKSHDPTQEVPTVKPQEELGANSNNNNCMLEQQKDEVTRLGEGRADGTSDSSHQATVPCQGQALHPIDSVPDLRSDEPDVSDHKGMHKASEDGDQEKPVASCPKSEDLGSEPVMELEENVINGEFNAGDMTVVNTKLGNGSTELEQCGEAPSFVQDKSDHSVAGTSSEVVNTNPETREFEELPGGLTSNEPAILEPEKDEQIEMSKNDVKQNGEVELQMSPDVTSPNAGAIDEDAEMQKPAELPGGLIDEDSAVEEVAVKEGDVLQSGEEERQMAFDGASKQFETQNVDHLEQQPEGAMEEQPIVQSEEQVKVGSHKDEELPGDLVLKVEEELPPQTEVGKDDCLPLVSEPIEPQPLSLPGQTQTHDVMLEDGPLDIKDGDVSCSSVLMDEVRIERSTEDSEYQPAATTVEDKNMQERKVECEDIKDEQSSVAESTAKEDVLVETQSTPVQKSESLPEKPIGADVSSFDESVTGAVSDGKLLEENEKLREMMQKLMEAGKGQLQIISDLTARVKDLEKKLARKKKVRTRRYLAAPSSGSSRVQPSNNPLKERGVGVVM